MARAIAYARTTVLPDAAQWLRTLLVCGCGFALVLAGRPLPF